MSDNQPIICLFKAKYFINFG